MLALKYPQLNICKVDIDVVTLDEDVTLAISPVQFTSDIETYLSIADHHHKVITMLIIQLFEKYPRYMFMTNGITFDTQA